MSPSSHGRHSVSRGFLFHITIVLEGENLQCRITPQKAPGIPNSTIFKWYRDSLWHLFFTYEEIWLRVKFILARLDGATNTGWEDFILKKQILNSNLNFIVNILIQLRSTTPSINFLQGR